MIQLLREFSKSPLFLLAIGIALSGGAYYFVSARNNPSNVTRRRVVALFSAIVFVSFFVYNCERVSSTHKSNAAYKSIEQPYSLSVVVSGFTKTSVQSERQTFRVSSGQLNVGCNDSRSATATWPILPGSADIESRASWQNVDNVKSQDVGTPHQEGSLWTVSGSIAGRDRNFFGDCPGGGHGELILEGSYRPQDTVRNKNLTVQIYSDKVSRGQKVFIPLPQEKDKLATSCEIDASAGSDVRSLKLTFKVSDDGRLTIAKQSAEGLPLAVTLSDGRLAISIP